MRFRRDMGRNGIVGTEPTTRVWVNGTFDVLHYGHIHLLQHARNISPNTHVCVGIDSDERVAQLKGDNRPVNSSIDRMGFLRAIRYVDSVQVFRSDDDLRNQIRTYNPHVMVIGEDYLNKPIIGQEYIELIHYVPRYKGLSSTQILTNK
jgi:rfaE bifunctional protein nucleotidyltransferase chain/domain